MLKRRLIHTVLFCVLVFGGVEKIAAQNPVFRLPGNMRRPAQSDTARNRTGGKSDTARSGVEHRNYSDDSLRVEVYSLSSVKPTTFDSSIQDFTLRFPVPATHYYLGNDGSATKSFLFSTPPRIGFDPGFHSHDVYKWKPEDVRFYSTPKPYTELGYILGGGQAQTIDLLHTQNVKPYLNVNFGYRLISSPGIFRNQKNYHTAFRIGSWYQSPRKRYNNYFVVLANNIKAGESGGILANQNYLDDVNYQRSRQIIPTHIGGTASAAARPFSSVVNTGRIEKELTVFLRQQYDLGKKDSIVTDSTVIPLFYPRLRFEHSFRYTKSSYTFQDPYTSANSLDSVYYDSLYAIKIKNKNGQDTVYFQDRWQEISNDFSVYQYPDAKNLQQYIKLGAELQLIKGHLKNSNPSLYNVILHGEYRNRTKNQKWDINAFGRLYSTGTNFGDYHFYASLQRSLGRTLGTLQIGGENINRSPSFIYDTRSSFYLDSNKTKTFGKENTFHFFANYYIPKLDLRLTGDYYFVTNYLYLNGYRSLQQENALFNLLRVSGFKTFNISRVWKLHSEVYVQQKAGGAAVNVPVLYTRNRLAYEGKFFRNLNLSTGLEIRYRTPYKADNYSPVLGQFFYQDTLTISNRPDVNAFLHMRIRTFKAYLRVENLNTATFVNGFGFNHNNLAAPYYPLPGMYIRFGIYWTFVN